MESASSEGFVKVGHIARLNPSSSELSKVDGDTDVSFIPLDGFGVKGEITYRETRSLEDVIDEYTYFSEGDIAIAKITPSFENGKGAVCDSLENGIGFGTTEIHVLRAKEGIEPKFLWYALRTKRFRDGAEAAMRGSAGQQRVPSEFITNYEIPDYDLDKQRKIVDYIESYLSNIREASQRCQSLIESSRAEIDSLIIDVVTRGIGGNSQTIDSDVGWIGEVPEHWDVVRTRFVAELHSGHTPDRSNDEYWEDTDIPWVTTSDIKPFREGRKRYLYETEHQINELGMENSGAHLLPEGTVFLSRTASVGFSGIMGEPMATSQDFANWVCSDEIIPEYLLYVFRSMEQEFNRLMQGSTHQTIYMPDIKSFKTPLPPLEEQREIVDHIETETERLWELIDRVEETIDLLEEKRQALITAAVSGQIDVSDVKNEAKASHI
ncbi:restriction endonuclease subunit S [Halobellus rufus]|uniref:restriction endonuclease subunit S n=1 Tax=Halobellus rufus TaxID=1448860 RepID=UPI0012E0BB00|nr:restriction endonuclease subunit S [Halobellus rufus]